MYVQQFIERERDIFKGHRDKKATRRSSKHVVVLNQNIWQLFSINLKTQSTPVCDWLLMAVRINTVWSLTALCHTILDSRVTRGPFLTSPLGANFDLQGRSCPQGVKFFPRGESYTLLFFNVDHNNFFAENRQKL
jgi:hypothetical protein